jgi:uncharacterized protein
MDYTAKHHTSLYTIFIPLDSDSSEWMLVHGYTGAMDIVNNNIAQFLRKGGALSQEKIDAGSFPCSTESLERLIKRGYITSKAPVEEKAWVHSMANYFHDQRRGSGASFCMLVAYDCNFRCPYCFENGISNNGKGWSKKTFTKDSVDRAYEAMLEIEPDINRIVKNITLYGGEPLLGRNHAVVDYMVRKGLEKGFQFSAITNGYELQHYKDLLGPDKIKSLQITIDGPKAIHDTRRTHFEDGSTFDRIMDNIEMSLGLNVAISVRINTEVKNFEYIQELHELFKERGFFNSKYFSVYSGLIHSEDEISCNVVMSPQKGSESGAKYSRVFKELDVADDGTYNPDAQYINFDAEQARAESDAGLMFHYDMDEEAEGSEKMRTMNRVEYMNKFREAFAKNPELKVSCQDFGLPSRIMNVLQGQRLVEFQSTFCGAQNGMYILDPCGDIYTCWELVGQDEFLVGSYKDGIVFDREAVDKWQGKNISKVDACSKCKYAFFCGGGCMAGALREGRGYNSPHCDGYPRVFQDLVPRTYFKYQQQLEDIAAGKEAVKEEVVNQII